MKALTAHDMVMIVGRRKARTFMNVDPVFSYLAGNGDDVGDCDFRKKHDESVTFGHGINNEKLAAMARRIDDNAFIIHSVGHDGNRHINKTGRCEECLRRMANRWMN